VKAFYGGMMAGEQLESGGQYLSITHKNQMKAIIRLIYPSSSKQVLLCDIQYQGLILLFL